MTKPIRILLIHMFAFFLLFYFSSSALSQEYEAWTNLGLYGGEINDIAIDPNNPDKMFVGTWQGDGLFVTEDGGNSWQAVETENDPPGEGTFKNHVVFDVEIAPSDSNVIWVAHKVWVEKSTDGGQTWTHIYNSSLQDNNFRFCHSVAIDPTDPQTVYVGTGGPNNTFTEGAIYKTVDGGETWTKLSEIYDSALNPIPAFNYPVISIEIDANSNNIWAQTNSDDNWWGTTYRSNNQGGSWIARTDINTRIYDTQVQPHATGQPSNVLIVNAAGILRNTYLPDEDATLDNSVWVLGPYTADASNVRSFAIDPQSPETLYASWQAPISWGGDGIIKVGRSTDSGDNWSIYQADLVFKSLEVHPSNSEVIIGGGFSDGVFKSVSHGQTWTPINNGINAVIVHDIAVDPNDSTHLLAGAVSGVYVKQGTSPWTGQLSAWIESVRFHPTDSATYFAATGQGYLYKTIDSGQTWNSYYVGVFDHVRDIAIDPVNTNTVYVAVGDEIRKSIDGGVTFNNVLTEPYAFNVVVIDPNDNNHIFAGGGNIPAPMVLGNLWESTNGGTNWALTGLQNEIVSALLIDPNDPNSNIMYAGCGYSSGTLTPLYKSIDGGATWTLFYNGIPDNLEWNNVTDLEFHRLDTNIIYASTQLQGVYISPNQGNNWLKLGQPEYIVNSLAISSLYAGTEGGLLQCTGTGVMAGQVADNGTPIDNATVFNDFGIKTTSVNGVYMMVCPTGIFDVTVVADGYDNATIKNVLVLGGDVSWPNFDMDSGVSDPSVIPGSGKIVSTDKEKYCFIATAEYGSSLLEFSASVMAKVFICMCILICSIVVIRRHKARRKILKKSASRYAINIMLILIFTVVVFSDSSLEAATLFQQVGIASSPNPVGSGARAVGMGGSFIAVADDATAASWNPAGLIQLETPELSLVVDYINRKEEFSSSSRPEISNTGETDYSGINYFSAAYPFNYINRNMVVSINYQRLYDFERNFDYLLNQSFVDSTGNTVDLSQKTDFSQDGSIGALGLAASVEITPRFSFGLTLNIWTDELFWENGWDQKYSANSEGTITPPAGLPVPYTVDTKIDDKYSSFRGINANFGLLWNANENLTVGAVVKTPFTASLRHEYNYESTQTVDDGPPNTSYQSVTESVELDMPLSYGVGLAWRASDAFTMDLDIYRTMWENYILTDSQGNSFSPIDGRLESESNVTNTTQVRIGGEYLFIREKTKMAIPLRAGIFYDPEPSEDKVKDFYGFAVGSGIAYKQFIFDVAYQFRWGNNVDTGNLIATSKADITQHSFLASVIWHF